MNPDQHPYANLSPDLILNAIEHLGFHCTGSLFALNSYENRVYQVGIEDNQPLVVKFYRPQRWTDAAILEEHKFAAELMSHEIPVIAPLTIKEHSLHQFANFRFALFPRQSGRTLELDNWEHLEWMGRFIGRLHAVGATRSFVERTRLDINNYGYQPYRFLMENQFIPEHLQQNFAAIVETALSKIEQIFELTGEVRYLRLHGDCHAGNVLWTPAGPHIVDLDDCLMGPAIQDIWMLLSGNSEQVKLQLDCILEAYQEFHDFNYRELHLIEALRTLRMLHYSAWLAKRWQDPAFPLSFPWFNTPRYWEEQLRHLQEQIDLMDSTIATFNYVELDPDD